MKKSIVFTGVLLSCMSLMGCSGAFWGGTGAGVIGAGAGYEYQAQRQMDQIEQDLKNGTITQEEYNIRKDQIQRGSLLK